MPRFIASKHRSSSSPFSNARPSTLKPKINGSSTKQAHATENTVFQGRVRDIATNGKGVIEHSSGIAVFVAGVWFDELVKIKINTLKKHFAEGELVEVLEPHTQRIAPICNHFVQQPACGGCSWQFVNYSAQLEAKQHWVIKAFNRLVADEKAIDEIRGSEAFWGYRNRAEFKSDGKRVGYLASQSKQLVDIDNCLVLHTDVAHHLDYIRSQLPNGDWAAQSSKPQHRSQSKKTPPYTLIAVDQGMPVGELRVNSRLDFRQANDKQNLYLKQWLQGALAICNPQEYIIELFAGSGNFTQIISDSGFQKVIAVELSADAIDALNSKALIGITGLVGNLFDRDYVAELCRKYPSATTLVLDPPREGFVCIEPIIQHKNIETIAYISCNLSTCLRDVKKLVAGGFEIKHVQPVDMFPQTPHLELCVLLSRFTAKSLGKNAR